MKILHLDFSSFFKKAIQKSNLYESLEFLGGSSIAEAWEILEKQKIDLILSGQELRDGNLEALLRKLEKSPFREIPVILITSNDTFELRKKYFNLGVVDFIRKEKFTPENLEKHLNHFENQIHMISKLGSASVAILDDSQLSLNTAKTMLSMYQIENIRTFTDPLEFLKDPTPYDIYLIDLVLPGMSGEEVVQELRRKYPYAVIIAVSSLEKYNTIVHVLDSGADDYIIKPYDARLLFARLKSSYRSYQMMKKLDEQNKIMEEMSITDGLTGVKNHRYLMDRLSREISIARRNQHPLSPAA